MIFPWILLAIVAIVLLLLFVNVHFTFVYREKARVTLRVLCFSFDAMKLFKKFSEEKKEEPKKKEKVKEKKPTEAIPKRKEKGDFFGFAEFLLRIARIVAIALKEQFAKTKVHLKELFVSVGTDDAAKTALSYGGAVQAANYLFAFLQRFSRFRCNWKKLSISPDFTADKSHFAIHLDLSVKPIHVIGVLLRAYLRLFEGKDISHARNSVKTGH